MERIVAAAAALGMVSMLGTVSGCAKPDAASFGDDLAFLKKHVDVVVLSGEDGLAQVAVVGAYQGRVMTSAADGLDGLSFGWINRELIASGEKKDHMNPYGGEDRFWIGPEGGQFSIYFAKGAEFKFENWQVPAIIDTEAFDLVSKTPGGCVYGKQFQLTNWSGTKLDVAVRRQVNLLDGAAVKARFGVAPPTGVKMVAYESVNQISNKGKAAWTKKTGMLSVWILGMYNASPSNTVVAPFVTGPEDKLGKIVTDDYFGKVPAERLKVDAKRGLIFFNVDANCRSKIGLSPKRAKPLLGSYDAANKALTLVTFNKPKGVTDYVNSLWKLQKAPFAGDAVNSYNDGVNDEGKRMGNFYELETSSPAAGLKPGESLTHVHTTAHFQGDEAELDKIARATLGISLAEIQAGLK